MAFTLDMNLCSSPHCSRTVRDMSSVIWARTRISEDSGGKVFHQNATPLEHVGPVEDGLLVVVMLERDHKRRPASDLGPGVVI